MTQDDFVAICLEGDLTRIADAAGCVEDINANDSRGYNPILAAATMNRPDILEELISYGADVNVKSSSGHDALTYAAIMSANEHKVHPRVVELLMENGADYYDAMMIAIKANDSDFASMLIKGGADLNTADCEGRSFVMYSVMTGGGILRTLLENGADPNIADANGRTPLMISVIDEELEDGVIDTLLEFGADIDAGDSRGLTALMWAVAGVNRSPNLMMPMLIRTGAVRAEGWQKWSAFIALYAAVRHRLQIDIVRHMIEAGADVNIIDKRGMNAIMYAMVNGDDESADMLSEAGAQMHFDMI